MEDFISVVVPAYNEAARIPGTLERIGTYLREHFTRSEIIVVDDGSTDGTEAVVTDFSRKFGNIRLIGYAANRGKGYAIRKGVLDSQGSLLLISDADLSTPIEEMEKLIPFISQGIDIVIGSRGLDESNIAVRQPWYREKMGKIFNLIVRVLVIGGIRDTQCGFKLFKGDLARSLFGKSLINGFAFDVEILILARKSGYRIKEVPVRWLNSPNSRVKLLRDPIRMFFEVLKIRINLLAGRYNPPNSPSRNF
jgi:dolichyl-phosphate beta-glucosyltransferase